MEDRLDLGGIIPATVTPMDSDAEIDEGQLRGYIQWLAGHKGLKGVAINMDTGEGPHLTDDERRLVTRVWKEELRGSMPILAGVCGRSTREAAEQASMYREAGADALVVFPPPVFAGAQLDPKIPVAYHEAIWKASGLPLILFQLQPALAGAIFTENTLLALCELEGAAALKEASFDAVTFMKTAETMKKSKKAITLLTGNDNFIYESFLLGATGALIGFGTLAVSQQVEMHAAAMRGDNARGLELWLRVKPLADTVFDQPVRDYRARTKAALVELGAIKTAHMRPPLFEVGGDEVEAIREALKQAYDGWE